MKGKSGLKSSKKVKYKFVSKLLNGDSLLPYREATQLNSPARKTQTMTVMRCRAYFEIVLLKLQTIKRMMKTWMRAIIYQLTMEHTAREKPLATFNERITEWALRY